MTGSNRRSFLWRLSVLGSGVTLFGFARQAQSPRRIGLLIGGEASIIAAFSDELDKLGYVKGRTLVVEARISRPNSMDLVTQAAELAHMDVELVVAAALPQALEIRNNNPSMRMVIATCPGMVSNGFAATLEHPGGNVTGMDELPPGVTAKRLNLLKAVAPNVSRVALLSTTPGRGGYEVQLADAEEAARTLGVTVRPYRAASLAELESALNALAGDGMNGLLNFQGGLSLTNRQMIVNFAARHSVPAMYQATLFAEAGGLMAWAPDLEEQFRVAARTVDRILKGANPGDIPIQYPARYYLTINGSTAQRLGLTIPPAVRAQADRILA